MILHGPGHNLRSGGRVAVDEHDERIVVWVARSTLVLPAVLAAAPAHRDDCFAALDELACDFDGLPEESAGVVAQVEDDLLHPLLAQTFERRSQLVGGGLREAARHPDVADAGAEHKDVADRRLRHGAADDGVKLRGIRADALYLNRHALAFRAAHRLRDFGRRPVARVLAVHFDEAVAEAQARHRRRRAFERRLHVDAVAPSENRDADARKARLLILKETLIFSLGEEVRVRVERREHALNGGLASLVVIDLVGVVRGDEPERLCV